MSDLSTDQTLRAAFAKLRTADHPICPPGTEAAHRTVRRRRRIAATSATAGLAGILAISGGYLATADRQAPNRGTVASPQAAAEAPGMPAVVMGELERTTVSALGMPPSVRIWLIPASPNRQADGPVRSEIIDHIPDGVYTLRVACGDRDSSATLTMRVFPTRTTFTTAKCGTTLSEVAAGVGQATVVVAGPVLSVQIIPDDAALADGIHPAVAYTLSRLRQGGHG